MYHSLVNIWIFSSGNYFDAFLNVIWIFSSYFDAFFFCIYVSNDDLLYVVDRWHFRMCLLIVVSWNASLGVLIPCQGETGYALVLHTLFPFGKIVRLSHRKEVKLYIKFCALETLGPHKLQGSVEHSFLTMQRRFRISLVWISFLIGAGAFMLLLLATEAY